MVTLPVIAGCLASGAQGLQPTLRADGVTVYGEASYAWPLQTLDGRTVILDEHRGEVLFINMWATWCQPCVAEMGSIERLIESMEGTQVRFLLVSPEDAAPVERFLARYDYDLPVFLEGTPMPSAYGLRALPTTYIVDRRGDIVLAQRGAAEWDTDAIRNFLSGLAE